MSILSRTLTLVSSSAGCGILFYTFRKNEFNNSLFLPQVHCQSNIKKHKLICAQVFFRHGARTQLNHAPGIEFVSFFMLSNNDLPVFLDILTLIILISIKMWVLKTQTIVQYLWMSSMN